MNGDQALAPPHGRVAVVTGAARGLGLAIATRLAQAGALVVLCDILEDELQAACAQLQQQGLRARAYVCDVSNSAAVAETFRRVAEDLGPVGILVNNAAVVPGRPDDTVRRNKHYAYMSTPVPRQSLQFTSELSDEEWLRVWDVNVHGLFYCTREALRQMQAQHWGRIINIASIAGISAMSAHSPHYSATKGAVVAFTKSVALEVAGDNIQVNAIAPGGVHTPQFGAYLESLPPERRAQLWQLIPAGRLGTLEEYAETALHLASNHYLYGQIVSPNGGAVI